MRPSGGGKFEQAGNRASLEAVARLGLIAYGVVHLLISWLALQLAWGASARKSPDRDNRPSSGVVDPGLPGRAHSDSYLNDNWILVR